MKTVLCLAVSLSVSTVATAYDEIDHRDLTLVAIGESQLGKDFVRRKRLGISKTLADESQRFPNSKGDLRTVRLLFGDAAVFEDEGMRSLNHFFNPVTGRPLQVSVPDPLNQPIWVPAGAALINQSTVPSPNWALDDFRNDLNYARLKSYYYEGLTSTSSAMRSTKIGLAFEALGRLVHHVQDMAQPQHVRNDAHWYDKGLDACDRAKYGSLMCDTYLRLRARSTYEQWTHESKVDFTKFAQYTAIYDGTAGQQTPLPRHFWTNAGRGLADFTNRNFRSSGTMEVAPPVLSNGRDILASELCAGAVPACEVQDLDHVVSFWESFVDDQLRPATSGNNPMAAAASIFEWDFRKYAPAGQRPFTLNRFTFEKAHAFLLPRAIGYSTGFINYFFRGDMDFAPPDEGVFAAVDTKGCGVPCGFRVLKLKIRNTTPNDAMGAGTLRIVAKYRLNTCYLPDLSGDDGGPAFLGESCRSAEEGVAVSDPQAVASVPVGFGTAIPFSFPGTAPIPINASDLSLQVIFRGKLGEEDDAVAVSTLDIGEPNYVAIGNLTDYVYYDGDERYSPLVDGDYPVTLNSVSFGFQNPATAPPLATVTSLRAGEHAQFAFLTTKATPHYWLRSDSYPPYPSTDDAPFDVEEFFKDEELPGSAYSRTCPVILERGQYRQFTTYYLQMRHGRFTDAVPGTGKLALRAGDGRAAKYGSNCRGSVTPGSNGPYDLSYLSPPYGPPNSKSWTINFP